MVNVGECTLMDSHGTAYKGLVHTVMQEPYGSGWRAVLRVSVRMPELGSDGRAVTRHDKKPKPTPAEPDDVATVLRMAADATSTSARLALTRAALALMEGQ